MNSMAIIDTQQIISEAEIIGLRKRVLLVYDYENVLVTIFDERFNIFSKKKFNRYVLLPFNGRNLSLYEPSKLLQPNLKHKRVV